MTRGGWIATCLSVFGALASARVAAASSHRVAAVDPDPELARALRVALAAWDVEVVEVPRAAPEAPGATMPAAIDRARSIARSAAADVVVWVSTSGAGESTWIYDLALDRASARALDERPPFDPETAAAVALAVKALLRGTAIAPPERRDGDRGPWAWSLGAFAAGALRPGSSSVFEGRFGGEASVWPAPLHGAWGLILGVESGTGIHAASLAFDGSLNDTEVRLAVGVHAPLTPVVAVDASIGAGAHVMTLAGSVGPAGAHVRDERVDGAIEPRVAVEFALLRERLHVGPTVDATLLTRWQHFLVQGAPVLDVGPVAIALGVGAAVAWP